ncbi:hypothetical protein [Halovenus amylolytica]|uniref:hypothetical protein n=1 Tax=Halovenus amylolytica TaxID=2500550 RepID=UPI003607F6F8
MPRDRTTDALGGAIASFAEFSFAVGRARMHGREMVESTRGIASSVRHVEEN